MKISQRLFIWLALPLILIGIGGAWFLSQGGRGAESYLTAKVERGDIEDTVSALGTLQPVEYVDVGTQVTGQLKTLHVVIGQQVKQGDLVAEIDPTIFGAKVEASEASLQNARALILERTAQRRLAQQEYARNSDLYTDQAVSQQILEQSKAVMDQAAAQLAESRAQAAQIDAQLKGDRANLSYTKIFAPMSGTVVSLTARMGQTLVSSQQAPIILRIADLNTMTVWAQVSEADVPKITLGMPVYFTTLGLPERRWSGVVRQVLPTPVNVNNVILYNVLFDVPNADQVLKPEMSAQASFVIAGAKNKLIVPVAALRAAGKHRADQNRKAGGGSGPTPPKKRLYMVRVLQQDGRIEKRQVEIGVMSRIRAEVIAGLAEGEDVIVGVADESRSKAKSKSSSRPGKI